MRQLVPASKVRSKLAKLEREIGAAADRIQHQPHRVRTAAKDRNSTAQKHRPLNRLIKIVSEKIAILIASCRKRVPLIATATRRIISVTVQGVPLQGARNFKKTTSTRPVIGSDTRPAIRSDAPRAEKSRAHEIILIAIIFSMFTICGITITVLFMQIKELKMEMSFREQNLLERINQLEKTQNQKITKEVSAPQPKPQFTPMTLSNDDQKLIRQFIKVLPPKPGTEPKIHLGEPISDTPTAPVPTSLVEQLPKLRGARFSLDQNGAIIIIGAGSARADAIIAPH